MLEELSVTNYALIDDIQISFKKGLNILTGETGAGKSLLVGALGLIFGKKGSPSFVKQGADEASISALVDITSNLDAKIWLKDTGIHYEDDQVLIKRNIKNSGRGSQYIQGQGVLRAQLEEFSTLLFDMHGQHEHQSLFNKINHRKLVDRFGRLSDDVDNLNRQFQVISRLREDLVDLEEKESNLDSRIEYLKKSIKEIEESGIYIGEEEKLEKELKLLRNTDKIITLLDESHSFTKGSTGVIASLKTMTENIDHLAVYDELFKDIYKRIKDCFYEVEDISESLSDYKRQIDYSPETLSKAEERLSEIFLLEKKYGTNIKDVLEFLEDSKKELKDIETSTDRLEQLKERIRDEQTEILKKAKKLSIERKEQSVKLEESVTTELAQLSLPNVRFKVEISERRDSNNNLSCGPWGMDEVEFLMSMNPGEPLKPVKQIASGGEISRIMLALKSVLADVDNIGCLIFDEIDSGIGGEVALSIGDHLKKLSESKQILSITHLASIASCGSSHLKVVKTTDGEKTKTDVIKLDGEQRVREIARMLSGECNEASMNHARELLGSC